MCARLPPASAAMCLEAFTASHRQPARPQALSRLPPNGFPRCRQTPPNGFPRCCQLPPNGFPRCCQTPPNGFPRCCRTAFRALCGTADSTLSDTANDTANDTALPRFPKGLQPIRDTANDTNSDTICGTNRSTL